MTAKTAPAPAEREQRQDRVGRTHGTPGTISVGRQTEPRSVSRQAEAIRIDLPDDHTTFRANEDLTRGRALIAGRTMHRAIHGDARVMPDVADGSVHLVLTSPPYWTLKTYAGAAGAQQLGHVTGYEQFLVDLGRVWQRAYDALVPGGRLIVNVGDVALSRKAHGEHQVMPLGADIIGYARAVGFRMVAPHYWAKKVNVAAETGNGRATMLGTPYQPNPVVKLEVEHILMFRKPGGYRKRSAEMAARSRIPDERYFAALRQIWTDIPGASTKNGHPAPFPLALACRLIELYSYWGDVVLDPFGGSGTVAVAAASLGRSSVLYEIEPDYLGGMERAQEAMRTLGVELTIDGPREAVVAPAGPPPVVRHWERPAEVTARDLEFTTDEWVESPLPEGITPPPDGEVRVRWNPLAQDWEAYHWYGGVWEAVTPGVSWAKADAPEVLAEIQWQFGYPVRVVAHADTAHEARLAA